jgi:uncharacterized protein
VGELSNNHLVTSTEELEALYGVPGAAATDKEQTYLTDHYKAFVDASPFVIVATIGPEGLDCSPRGDPAGFVRVHDQKTVILPDRRGNNRLDTLRNVVRDPRVSLLFLIPGAGETLRINGQAKISTDPELCATFTMQGKNPTSVLIVTIDVVYFQCKKALTRSKLWAIDPQSRPKELPTAGQMIEAISKEPFDGAAYDKAYPEREKKTIY